MLCGKMEEEEEEEEEGGGGIHAKLEERLATFFPSIPVFKALKRVERGRRRREREGKRREREERERESNG